MEKGYELSDVLLIPRHSRITSRNEPDISVDIKGLHLEVPIIASPMKGIVGVTLIREIAKLGGIGILHRFWKDKHEMLDTVASLSKYNIPFGISTGLEDTNYTALRAEEARMLVLDVANGYLSKVIDRVKLLREWIDKFYFGVILVAGNVVTYEGARALKDAGADIVRVGIGNGSLCVTRNTTGVGVPQLTALQNTCGTHMKVRTIDQQMDGLWYTNINKNYAVISDGGVKYPGDMAKALAAGADLVMLGSPLANTFEAETGSTIYGMASARIANYMGKEVKSIEGMEIPAPKKTRSLEDLVNEFSYGLKSCMTYMNAKNLQELRDNADWICVGSNSLTNTL